MRFRLPVRIVAWLLGALVHAPALIAADPDQLDGVLYFEQHIRPLLAAHCYACHSTKNGKREGGLLLDSRAGWTAGGDRGPAIIPGKVAESPLIQAVRYVHSDLQMPPEKPLPRDAISRLEYWVRIGAPDPRDAAAGQPPGDDPSDPVTGRSFWSYQPLAEPSLPAVAAADWPRTAVDRFVLAKLEAAKLPPPPTADRRTLVRRVFIQLIGLPPTPEQVAEFLEDSRPDAFDRLVDVLLNSPQFGERWGRHWLDLARYADSNGLDENFLFREAWRYRNWVIDALNNDLPFDQFVLEQVAGDLLPHDSIDQRDRQRIAAGFLVIGPKVLLGNDEKKQRMEVADEQLDTLGRAILGQTLGCARCHDHKFDPVPTADYYAMAGILTSTQVMEQRYMLGQQRLMERLVGLGSGGIDSDEAYEKFWREQPGRKEKQKHARSALQLLEKGDHEAIDALVKEHAEALSAGAADTKQTIENRIEAQKVFLAGLDAEIAAAPKIPPRAMIPTDVAAPENESIRLAGQFDRLGAKVPRGFLRVLGEGAAQIPEGRSGRLELARWLTDENHGAAHLAARVLANRVWHHLIGSGIVRTVDNFGRTGEPPSHPELLDYLARELIDSKWSLKHLVRTIVLSRTFAASSGHNRVGQAIDPDNRLLWRAHRRRLEPEVLRDALLSAAGQLSLQPMDSSVWYLEDQATAVGDNKVRRRTDFPCRSVYLPVIRNDLPELFQVFDFADPHATTGMRPQTMVATQGLFLLNDDSVMKAAEATVRRIRAEVASGDRTLQLDRMFELVLNVRPAEEAQVELLDFITEIESGFAAKKTPDADLHAWTMACHALFVSSRFQILD